MVQQQVQKEEAEWADGNRKTNQPNEPEIKDWTASDQGEQSIRLESIRLRSEWGRQREEEKRDDGLTWGQWGHLVDGAGGVMDLGCFLEI